MPTNYIEIECPYCHEAIRCDIEIEPADPHYGADADGNRSIYVYAYAYLTDDEPTECPHCKVDFLATEDMDWNIHELCEKALEKFNEEL
jgi:hypothetical protein